MYEFGRFRFDPENHLLQRGGEPVSLSPKAFEILLLLVQNGNGLTTKEEVMRKVWRDSFVEEANLTVTISALRKQLGLDENGRQHIETVPKKGYRFAVPVRQVGGGDSAAIERQSDPEVGAEGSSPEPIPTQVAASERNAESPFAAPARKRNWFVISIAAAMLAVFIYAAVTYISHRPRPSTTSVRHSPHRLAVLPFQNLQEASKDDFLGFSLADSVITKLGYVSELAVRPSYAIQKYKMHSIEIQKVAAELDVDTLLTGTYLRDGDDLRIAYQLIDVKTRDILWKGEYDLKYDKLLTVQDKVAQQIIQGLELNLSAAEAGRLKTQETTNPLAYEYYLRGVDLYSKNDFPLSIKMLEKSTELAPRFAISWANLGKAYTANASFHFGGGQQYRKAQAAFEKAIELQPDEIDARIYMANMFTDTGRVELAVPLLREALRKNPNHAEVHWELGYAYRFAGMLPEAVTECERARQLDPGVKIGSSTPNAYLYLGQYDRFLNSLPQGDDNALIVFYRGLGEYYKNDSEKAVEDFDRAFEYDSSVLQAEIGRAFGLAIRRQRPQAESVLQAVEDKINQRGVMDPEATYKIAQGYAILGDKKSALRVLAKSIDNGFFPYPYFLSDPLLNTLRGEAAFSQLMISAGNRHGRFKSAFF